jgi:hypothetical protein
MNWFSAAFNKEDFGRLVKSHALEAAGENKIKIWYNDIKNLHHSTARAIASIASWVNKYLLKFCAEEIMRGIGIGVCVVGMFFTLSMVGQFLAPSPAAYNQRLDSRQLYRPNVASRTEEYSHEIDLIKKSSYRVYIIKKDSESVCNEIHDDWN